MTQFVYIIFLLTDLEVCTERYFAQRLCTVRGQNILRTDRLSSVNKHFIKWLHLWRKWKLQNQETIQSLLRDGPLEKWWEGWDIFSLHEFFFCPSVTQEFFSQLTPLHKFFSLPREAIEMVNTFKTSLKVIHREKNQSKKKKEALLYYVISSIATCEKYVWKLILHTLRFT